MGDQLAHESFVILECDDALVLVTRNGLLELHSLLDQSLDPEADRAGKDRKRCNSDLTAALSAAMRIRPRKKSKDAAGTSRFIAEVEMIGGRIVEVHGALDEPQPEDAGVEIEISLRIARDTGNVMNAGGPETHPFNTSTLSLIHISE